MNIPKVSFQRAGLGRWLMVVLLALLVLPACKPDKIFKEGPAEYSADAAMEYIDLQLKITKETAGYTPPVAARAFAYTGLGLYEAMRYGMEGYASMAGQVNDFTADILPEAEEGKKHHWGVVASANMATLLRGLYPTASDENKAAITALESKYAAIYKDECSEKEYERSVKLGTDVANSILAYAATDGQSAAYTTNFPTSYVPPVGPGLWQPTPPAFSRAMQPYWGDVRPFLDANISASLMPATPPPYDTDTASAFYGEMMEVYTTVNSLTTEQQTIASYWSDDPGATFTPSGHSISIMKQILIQEGANLDLVAEAYAKCGMAVHDAFVCCWRTKFSTNYLRPITAIRDLVDSNWTSYRTTPPFPEYTSGHSSQSGAVCAVLVGMFGEGYEFTDRSHEGRTDIDGTARSFISIEAFAGEAAISRLYGGIHYRSAIELGMETGVKIGTNIQNLGFH